MAITGTAHKIRSEPPGTPLLIRLATALRRLSRLIEFVGSRLGVDYGIGRYRKLRLAIRILRNYRSIESGSEVMQHLLLAEEVMRVPASVQGDVVECGCYRGSMTATLSLVCALTKRRLFVCDSFDGLPAPTGDEREVTLSDGNGTEWKKGDWASLGGVEGVKNTIAKYGAVEACTFVEGYFCDTLKHLDTEHLVLVFEDGDLISSVTDCITALWPKLHGGCKFFCHEPWSFDIVALFFDVDWWWTKMGEPAPGFKGSIIGLPRACGIGFATRLKAKPEDNVQLLDDQDQRVYFFGDKGRSPVPARKRVVTWVAPEGTTDPQAGLRP